MRDKVVMMARLINLINKINLLLNEQTMQLQGCGGSGCTPLDPLNCNSDPNDPCIGNHNCAECDAICEEREITLDLNFGNLPTVPKDNSKRERCFWCHEPTIKKQLLTSTYYFCERCKK